MSKKTFYVRWEVECEIEIDEEVLSRVDDEWRSVFYSLHTNEDIANHIAYNLFFNQWPLSHLDGWADMKDNQAKIVFDDVNDLEVREI
jgi:Ser-tRNA(Ala) deacylase AlaX